MSGDTRTVELMRTHVLEIFNSGVDAVAPAACIQKYCHLENHMLTMGDQVFDLDRFKRIMVLGAGKASAAMAGAIEDILGERISEGCIVTKYGHGAALNTISLVEAAHPVPDEAGVSGAQDLLRLAEKADEKTLVICLISGGGSALTPLPAKGLTLADKQQTTRTLLECGADIHEINTIRKHLSQFKGGRLARAVFPATMACLVISDVVGNDLSAIASGPAVPDGSTFGDCLDILHTYQIENLIPRPVLDHLQKGAQHSIPDTPKPGDRIFEKISHTIIADNMAALFSARHTAEKLGYGSLILSSMIEGEASQAARGHAAVAKEIIDSGNPLKPPACILSGGETTVTIKGRGKGGRNQEFALACARDISGLDHIVILSCGTDGTDGPTDAAGAIVDQTTLKRAENLGIDLQAHLLNNDAYPFFEKLGDLVKTGPTKTNVMDLRIILAR